MTYKQFQILMLAWNIGLVDTLSVLQLCANCSSQYMAIVLSSVVGNFSDVSPKVLLKPVFGLGTSYQFVRKAATIAKKRQKNKILASFLAISTAALIEDPATNAAIGSDISSKISCIKAIFARGDSSETNQYILNRSLKNVTFIASSIETSVPVHSYCQHFTTNCQININNMFQEHMTRRYIQASSQKIKSIRPTHLISIGGLTQTNNTTLISKTFFGVVIIGLTTLAILHLFQRLERKRW